MSPYSSQFETLIQLSGTFVALISGFAVSRYFSNFADIQRLTYERRLIEPKIESLSEQITSQREQREGNETARIFRELIDLFDAKESYSDSDLLEIIQSELSEEQTIALISEFRTSRKEIDRELSEKAGALIPDPTEATLQDLGIPYTDRNRSIYLDGIRRFRDLKRASLGVSNPFKLNLRNFDALTRQSYSIVPLINSNIKRRTESENVELFLEVEHRDKMLEAEILSRRLGMRMGYFVWSTSFISFFGILLPTLLLIFHNSINEISNQIVLGISTVITVGCSYIYVYKSVQSTKLEGKVGPKHEEGDIKNPKMNGQHHL